MKFYNIVVIFAILVWTLSLNAKNDSASNFGTVSGSDLLGLCKSESSPNTPANKICNVYIRGWMGGRYFGALKILHELQLDNENTYDTFGGSQQFSAYLQSFCRKGQSFVQLRLTIVKYLEKNPELLHQPAPVLIEKALSAAFPVEGCDYLDN